MHTGIIRPMPVQRACRGTEGAENRHAECVEGPKMGRMSPTQLTDLGSVGAPASNYNTF